MKEIYTPGLRRPSSNTADTSWNKEMLASYALFIGVAALFVIGFATPAFRVSRVSVVGAGVPVARIANAADVEGRNIFTIRAANIVHDVRRIPNVLVTGVHLAIPASVTIYAVLRKPLLAWKTKSQLFQVDKYGRIVDQVPTSVLPLVRDTTGSKISLGGYINEQYVTAIRYALKMLPHAAIMLVTLEANRGLVLRSVHGWRAVLGHPNPRELARRVFTLKALLSLHSRKRLVFANLTLQPPRVSRAG